ncbi:MAG: 50S ribosomal protein L11 methyltransferase [Plectolyngbya sp. WJT66-NPBG17]|nr:50S ribosomal protein L11 methyltransferase [Plectolyngbya sp. WJT66-NPBG17]MBW4527932.1 50S ribosomal protein L11 methyltransferase [Phormidium tanganyikae FI6-MK23]
MLNLIEWQGDETVLDIGTGRGLLMIGAAKRLTTGKAIGSDIWNAEDLTGNSIENMLKNAELEDVKDKIEIRRKMSVHEFCGRFLRCRSFAAVSSQHCWRN